MSVFITGAGIVPNSSGLPSGYTQLEYIESTGTQYIDTNIIGNSNLRIEASMQMTEARTWRWLFGSRIRANQAAIGLETGGSTTALRGEYGNQTYPYDIDPTIILNINFNKNICNVNSISKTYSVETFESNCNLIIFARTDNGTISSFSYAKLYYFKIYNDDILTRNFIPCKNSSDEIGLYDVVSQSFFANSGTGVFVAGPEL